jgi:peroxiredoxin
VAFTRLVALFALIPLPSPGADPVDPVDLVRRTAERYEKATTYHFKGTTMMDSLGVVYRYDREQAAAPDGRKYLFVNSPRREIGFASDGTTLWAWLPRAKQYTTMGAEEAAASGGHWAYGSPPSAQAELEVLLDTRYGKIDDRAPTATFGGRERVKTSKGKVDCYIIELAPGLQPGRLSQPPPGYTGPSVRRLWIGVEDGLIWKDLERRPIELGSERIVNVSTLWEIMEVDQPIRVPLFHFKPAGDMKQVRALDLPRPATTIRPGVAAPDFELSVVGGGKKLSLSSLRGKVVLVDFWTTWCPPCQYEMPALDKIYREFKKKGLEVVGVSDEQEDIIQQFRKAKLLSFPTVMDTHREAHHAYQVYALPTAVVIDREGKISRILVGGQGEVDLRNAIEAAGL